ncbi:MAG TPA: tetratricopeptide repeat protein [Pyrinomonadaceae bacterium]|nr:tetratricopeptide repeat protein [Pyrinomonadaceae bacterium]
MFGPETLNGEAYQHFTNGRMLIERKHNGDDETALAEFDKAIELDPNYANAYAGRADAKFILFVRSGSHTDVSEARTAVRKAIELDPKNVYALTIDCRILATYDWDRGEAEKECRKAVELDPENEGSQRELAFLLGSLGRYAEALQTMNKAIAIAPTSFNKRSRGVLLYLSRDYDAALDQFRQVSRTDPLFTETAFWLLRCYHMKQDQKDGFEVYIQSLERSGASADEIRSVREIFEKSGWNEVLRHIADNFGTRSMLPAGIYAQLGEKDKAFEILDDMCERRAIMLVTAAREPMLDPLRDDPRYKALMAKIGFPEPR